MTGRDLMEYLKTLDDEELEADVEIKLDYSKLSKSSFLWLAGVAVDCNGIYLCDEGGSYLFDKHRTYGDKSSWEVEE